MSWRQAETLSSFYPDIPRSERNAAMVIFEFSSFLGLGQDIVIRALCCFGWERLVLVMDYLGKKIGTISKPHGYLLSMISRFECGECVAGGRVQPWSLSRDRSGR